MSARDTERAAPAGTLRDPQVSDRLVGAIGTPPSIPRETVATVAAHHDRDWWRIEALSGAGGPHGARCDHSAWHPRCDPRGAA
jgi:hypothetical protein